MDNESVDSLIDRGFELLEEGEFEQAIAVGNELLSGSHTSGFEILASAYYGLEDAERAVAILETGVGDAPSVWLLWQLLGNYRSDLGWYAEAHAAYNRALACPGAEASCVHLNVAIALYRQKWYGEALKRLDFVEDAELRARAESVRLSALNNLEDYDEAIRRGEEILATMDMDRDEADDIRSRIEASLGEAYWRGQSDRGRAMELVWQSLAHNRISEGAMWLLREIEGQVSPGAVSYQIMVEGALPERDEEGRRWGFFSTYDVVADSVEEAMDYIRRFEGEEISPSLCVSEYEAIEASPSDPKGVYSYNGRTLFSGEDEDE